MKARKGRPSPAGAGPPAEIAAGRKTPSAAPPRVAPTGLEEKSLARAAKAGDVAALERLVFAHMGFIVSFARARFRGDPPLDDLIQEGICGFLEGLTRFDCDREPPVRLLTFARPWIERNVLRGAWREDLRYGGVRLPEATYHALGRKYRAGERGGDDLEALSRRRAVPLAALPAEDAPARASARREPADERAPSPLDGVIRQEECRNVQRALARLPERLRRHLVELYGIGAGSKRRGRPGRRDDGLHDAAIGALRELLRGRAGPR